eukprot:4059372-Amphidinium_carterae.1
MAQAGRAGGDKQDTAGQAVQSGTKGGTRSLPAFRVKGRMIGIRGSLLKVGKRDLSRHRFGPLISCFTRRMQESRCDWTP